MSIRKMLLFVLTLFSISLFIPNTSKAIDLKERLASGNLIVIKIQEGVEYFFVFKVENKIQVLDKHAEKRLTMAQGYAEKGNNEMVQNSVQDYLRIKERQNNLLGKINSGEVLGLVTERTIEQQKTMEEIKVKVDGDTQQNMIRVQERVVNQIAERVIVVNGTEGQTEFFRNVEHVWAPGTGPGGGEAGVVIVGGEMQFAPGTSAGGPAVQDIKTVEIKTGGTVNDPVPVPEGSSYAPGTTGGDGGDVVDSQPPSNTIDDPDGGVTNTIDP